MIDVRIDGFMEMQKVLTEFPPNVRRKWLRTGLSKVGRRIVARMKPLARKDSGTLAASIGFRVYTKGEAVGVVVGPMRRKWGVATRKKGGGLRRMTMKDISAGKKMSAIRIPTRYEHLVEFGSKGQQAHPFIRPAYDAGKAEAEAEIAKALAEGVIKEMHK